MSVQATARKIQRLYGVRYTTALTWTKDESNRAAAGNSRKEKQSFSDRLVEVVASRYGLKPTDGQTKAPHSSGKSETTLASRQGKPARRRHGNGKATQAHD